MIETRSVWCWLCCACLLTATVCAGEPATGWRGNATGLWPESTAPLEWHRLAHGAMEGLRVQANRPAPTQSIEVVPLARKGLMNEWLILEPQPVKHAIENFDDDILGGEATIFPTTGESTAGRTWKHSAAKWDDPLEFGSAGLPWVQLAKSEDIKPHHIAYAYTNVYSPRGGTVRGVAEHTYGLKVLVNGQEVFRAPQRNVSLGAYEPISRHELAHTAPAAGVFQCQLKPGWNRLLLKLSTGPENAHRELQFCLRLMDPPSVNYETKNIRWMSELPGRSTSTPIIVGNRIFLAAEPDQLVCLDKMTGKILWSASNNYLDALTPIERQALPALATRVDPLVSQLKTETDLRRRLELRRQIRAALVEIDPKRFDFEYDGHFAAHFGIVGFSMPTPVSDGTHVYVWCGMGVAACYDLDGHRKWISRVSTGPLEYGSSPALADGVLAVFLGKLYGLDARTGELKWTQPRVNKNIAAVLAATFAGQQVFVTQLGEVVRPRDGMVLFRPRSASSGDGGCWGPPVILGNRMYAGKYGVKQLSLYDFAKVSADAWKPELISTLELTLPREHNILPNGGWIDRATAGSPLIHDGLAYVVDIYGWLYVSDLATGATIYYKDLAVNGLMHYNAVPVAASPTLIGNHIVVVDNQGLAVVLKPGREFKIVARNRIETQLERTWPLPGQETLAYAPPIADGNRLYLRGERFLYCIQLDAAK